MEILTRRKRPAVARELPGPAKMSDTRLPEFHVFAYHSFSWVVLSPGRFRCH
jgi:hypothetical protein